MPYAPTPLHPLTPSPPILPSPFHLQLPTHLGSISHLAYTTHTNVRKHMTRANQSAPRVNCGDLKVQWWFRESNVVVKEGHTGVVKRGCLRQDVQRCGQKGQSKSRQWWSNLRAEATPLQEPVGPDAGAAMWQPADTADGSSRGRPAGGWAGGGRCHYRGTACARTFPFRCGSMGWSQHTVKSPK